jgi:hypothetical protein
MPLATCVASQCVPATIPDPNACTGSGCDIDHSSDAGPIADGAPIADAARDSATDAPPPPPPVDGGPGACDVTGAQAGAAWPMYGYCAAHRARSPYNGPTSPHAPVPYSYFAAPQQRAPVIDASGYVYIVGGSTWAGLQVVDVKGDPSLQTVAWSYNPPSDSVSAGYALGAGGVLYVPLSKSIVALDTTRQGKPVWAQPYSVPGGITGPLTIAPNGDIVFQTTGAIVALQPNGTTTAWSIPAADAGPGSAIPAVDMAGNTYFSTDDAVVWAIGSGGQQVFPPKSVANVASGAMAITPQGSLRLVTQTALFGLSLADGSQIFTQSFGGLPPSDAAIADDGTVYATLSDGNLHVWNPDGSPKAVTFAVAGPYGAPTLGGDGTIYVCCATSMCAFRPDGSKVWTVDTGLSDAGVVPAITSAASVDARGVLFAVNAVGYLQSFGP